ncbi:SEC14-like protein 4 [Orchesella cincta]|uniref:SEC14-like protein 4 n=1 Tax=Orchesella cincta TaxID=48709 RepID=A0A1D2MNN2_ORCCI|nr:SEC14-like protein 4 [Orchesella cincta]
MIYTPEGNEVAILQQFKEAVVDLNQADVVLLRFLRARDYDLENAEKMLRNAVKWREEIGIDNYLQWEFPPYYQSCVRNLKFVCWLFVGKWPVKQLLENGETEQMLRYMYTIMEKSVITTKECGTPGYLILDMDGLTYAQSTHIASLKFAYNSFQKMEQCFPEIIKALYIINAPWIFTFAFNFVKGVFAKRRWKK